MLAELLLGQPFFPGDSGVDQLVEIIKVLGTPTREEIQMMNPNYTEFRFPMIRPHPWQRVKICIFIENMFLGISGAYTSRCCRFGFTTSTIHSNFTNIAKGKKFVFKTFFKL